MAADGRPDSPASTRVVTLVAFVATSVLALLSALQTYLSMLNHGHSLVRLVLWPLAWWSFWAIVAPWFVRLVQRKSYLVVVLAALCLMVVHELVAVEVLRLLKPFVPITNDYTFDSALRSTWSTVVLVDPLICLLLVIGGKALAAYERARELELRESRLESELARAQLDALRLEIEPHFLFNTLNSIAALIRINDNSGALAMLLRLSDMMRATLDRTHGHVAPLSDELAIVTRYVDLLRARFGERLQVVYSIDAECRSLPVPAFLLQPLVENALRHGLASSPRQGRLEIGATTTGDGALMLWVSDNGSGLPAGFDQTRDVGTGLRNVRSRITRLYGGGASLTLARQPLGGTRAEVVLPGLAPAIRVTA